jgi:hypothetical protein
MANYVYVNNGIIEELHDEIPNNWKNVSNFYVLTEEERKQLGWYNVVKIQPEYDPNTQTLGYVYQYLKDNLVYETTEVIDKPLEDTNKPIDTYAIQMAYMSNTNAQWDRVRESRTHLMLDMEWKYSRYNRQIRLGLPTTDNISVLDTYMQQLADITTQDDPWNIVWPTPV